MITMEIFYDSLSEDAKNEYVGLFGRDINAEDGMYPIAVIEQEVEGDD